ncbi:hypothetical protein BASA83_002900 [Batrachochytrium salamandrivorans]|nr:hypothetical protein BASA83_002900 [Batrachochytrium salamandrivorans]
MGRQSDGTSIFSRQCFPFVSGNMQTTQLSPFFLLYGVDPRLPGDTASLQEAMVPLDDVERMEEAAEKTARSFDELGYARAAAYHRSKAQAETMRRRPQFGS